MYLKFLQTPALVDQHPFDCLAFWLAKTWQRTASLSRVNRNQPRQLVYLKSHNEIVIYFPNVDTVILLYCSSLFYCQYVHQILTNVCKIEEVYNHEW